MVVKAFCDALAGMLLSLPSIWWTGFVRMLKRCGWSKFEYSWKGGGRVLMNL